MANRIKRVPSSKRSAPVTRLKKFGSQINKRLKLKDRYQKSVVFAQKKPFSSFFIALGILLLVILIGSTIFAVKTPDLVARTEPKNVEVYRLGENASINVQGEVKKGGVIKIVAQSGGIVSSVYKTEGNTVEKGGTIIALSSNYQGGNASTLQRQLASLTYQNTKETYDIQKDLIERQRDLAIRQSENSEALRELTNNSIDETKTLIDLNTNILSSVKSNISSLQQSNGDPSQILSLQQVQAQLQAGTNQLQSQLRANEHTVNEDGEVVDLEKISKDIALAQLDLQEKGLEMSLKAAGISLKLAQVQEANMYPAAPFAGTIQRIHVKVGDNVSPGDILVTFSGGNNEVVVDALVSKEIAEKVSKITTSRISVGEKEIEAIPSFISSEATTGQLYSVVFTIDKNYQELFTDESFVKVKLSIGNSINPQTPYIPLDSVFQTQSEAYVFVSEKGTAKSKKITLGDVTGGYVTVTEGLSGNETIILTRTVIEGDKVTF